MVDWIVQVIDSMGYIGVTFLVTLEVVIPIIPSEIILPFSGFTASQGELSFVGVLVASTLGALLGALIIYYVAKLIGWERVDYITNRFGKYVGVKQKDIDKAGEYFDKYSNWVVLFGRFIPGVRSVVAIPAGLRSMPIFTFILLTIIGSFIWNLGLVTAGYLLGENYDRIEGYISPVSKIVLATIIIYVAYWVYTKYKKNKSK